MRKARYTKALPVYVTPEMRAELNQLAEDYEISVAEVTRVLLGAALQVVTPETWESLYGD